MLPLLEFEPSCSQKNLVYVLINLNIYLSSENIHCVEFLIPRANATIDDISVGKLKIAIMPLLWNFSYSIIFITEVIVILNMYCSKYVSIGKFAKRIGKVSGCVGVLLVWYFFYVFHVMFILYAGNYNLFFLLQKMGFSSKRRNWHYGYF